MRQRFAYFFNDERHFSRFLWGLTLVAFLVGAGLLLVPQARANSFGCTSTGAANGNLFLTDTISNQINNASGGSVTLTAAASGTANSDPYTSGACASTLGIFGQILCFFKTTIGQIVSTMYCNFQNELLGPLSIAIELYIIVLGVFFITGMTNMTAREAITALIKVGLVWAFAMNATWGIGIAYSFFMGIAEEGTNLVLGAVGSGSGGALLTQPDKVISSIFNYATIGSGSVGGVTIPSTLSTFCGLMLFTFFLLLFIALPMVAGAILAMIIQYIWLYARALLGYLTALVLIGFLFIMAPLFISFALFQSTRSIFDQWIKYLTSFSLQMVIVFAFLALLSLVPLGDFFSEILGLVRQYDITWAGFLNPEPVTLCSVCKYTISSTVILGATPGVYPITCAAGSTVIPIDQLFSSQDLVQAIVSQVVALWIIGNIMLDFIKKAPEFARDLSGRLPFAALLGGGAPGVSDAPSIDYGLGSIDQGVESLSNKLSDPDTYKGWKRVAPAAALMGPAFAGLFKRYGAKNAQAEAANTPANANETAFNDYQTAMSNPAKLLAQKKAAKAVASASGVTATDAAMVGGSLAGSQQQDGGSTPLSVARGTGVGRAIAAKPLIAAQGLFNRDKIFLDDSREQVENALADIERLKAMQASGKVVDAARWTSDLRVLREAGDMHLIGLTNLERSQKKVMDAELALREKVPDVKVGSQPSFSEQVSQSQQILRDLQLQVNVRQVVAPADQLGNIQNDIAQAQAMAMTAQTSDGLEMLSNMITSIQKQLV